MSGAEQVTVIIGIAGLAATVIGTAIQGLLANRRHARQLKHDRIVADRGALRDLLDTAAETIRRAMFATDDALARFRAGDSQRIEAASDEMRELTREAVLTSGRLALRLGRAHPICVNYEKALDVFADMHAELFDATPSGWRRYALLSRQPLAESFEGIVEQWSGRLLEARAAFIDAAREIAAVSVDVSSGATRRGLGDARLSDPGNATSLEAQQRVKLDAVGRDATHGELAC
jgi:hypothetical protein